MSEALTSHLHKIWTEVSSSVPHFQQVGLLLSPIIYIYIYMSFQCVMSSKQANNNPGKCYHPSAKSAKLETAERPLLPISGAEFHWNQSNGVDVTVAN